MTVATLTDVLGPAVAGHYAVPGLVVLGWEDAVAYVEAAEELGLPVILQAGPGCRKHTPVAILGKMFRHLAEQARVPVVCHIDHATTFEQCREGIDHGFTSVMIDGSMLTLDANIEISARVVAEAHKFGVSVEGEVGVVGYAQGAASTATTAEQASAFEKASGVDALAISIGNVHLQTEKAAVIDFAALKTIEALTHVPLVLHGGSGIASADRQKLAAQHRIKKFNVGTELRTTFGSSLRHYLKDNPTAFDRIAILSATVPALRSAAKAILTELRHPENSKVHIA
jgi:fructose-bisphosphate aldolase, class II